MEQHWRAELEGWLTPFLAALRHKSRTRMCPAYVAGLIGAGDRKSVQPMAARDDQVGYDQLHHFIADGMWDAAPLEEVLLAQADTMVGGDKAWLIVDDTALPKKGEQSVGVAPQYASALGKNANCQTLVSLTLASGEVPVTVGLRLFLPESWTCDPARLNRARVPEERRVYRSKPEIALQEIDRIRAAGVPLRLRPGRCRLRPERTLSSGPERAWAQMGSRHSLQTEGRSGECRDDLPRCQTRPPAKASHPRRHLDRRTVDAGDHGMAEDQLAPWHQGAPDSTLRSAPRARC
jgi:hypothetical protein